MQNAVQDIPVMAGFPSAGLPRRLAAMAYDSLPLLALLFLATFLALLANGGEAVPPGSLSLQLALLVVAAGFFVVSWHFGGQTPGMRAWRLRVECRDGTRVGWLGGCARFMAALVSLACFGLGFAWALVDRHGLTWHDRLAGTRVVLLPKRTEPAS